IGPNGAGKSTLLRALMRLVKATGSITLDGVETARMRARDLARHLLRFWFYLSPILYSASVILDSPYAKHHRWVAIVYNLNPWVHLVGSYRNVAYYEQPPDWVGLGALAIVSVFLLAGAILFFKRVEPTFAKVL
ncbi:MAG: ATP-binding cassette domain-containing protein, partial [Chloroflexota bacterium]